MTNIGNEIALALQGMDPDAARAYLADLKRDVIRAADQEAIEKESRLKNLRVQSQDELTADIARFDVRTGNKVEQQERMDILRQKQQLRIDLDAVTSLPAADYAALDAKRNSLVAEAESLRGLPTRGKGGKLSESYLRTQEIAKELKALPGNPDVVIPEPTPEVEE